MKYIQLKTIEDFKSVTENTRWKGKIYMWSHFKGDTCYVPGEDYFINLEKAEKLWGIEKRGNAFKDRTGERYTTNEGYEVEIIEYLRAIDVTIKYEDGLILKNIKLSNLKAGKVKKPHTRLGEKHVSNIGLSATIVEYIGYENISIQFEDGTILTDKRYGDIIQGEFKNPNNPCIFNVGYFGIGDYSYKKHVKIYSTWKGVLERCYDVKLFEKLPTYRDIAVCKEWHNFQNFAKWMEENYNPETMNRWHLDKDIICKECKIYSPNTCAFVPQEINTLLISCKAKRGDCPIGVTYDKIKKKFIAQITKNKKHFYLGSFSTPEEAFQAYKKAKEEYIKEVADKWRGQIADQVYQALINYKVGTDD